MTGNYYIGTASVKKLMLGNSLIFEKSDVPSIGRAWSIDLGSNYTNTFSEDNIFWNLFHPTVAQIGTVNGYILSNMKTEMGEITTLNITNVTAFGGASGNYADYISSDEVYPKIAVDSGINLSSPSILKLSGLDITKSYNVPILSVNDDNNGTIMNIGTTTIEKSAYNNYPLDNVNRYDNNSLLTIKNIFPNVDGTIDIT